MIVNEKQAYVRNVHIIHESGGVCVCVGGGVLLQGTLAEPLAVRRHSSGETSK